MRRQRRLREKYCRAVVEPVESRVLFAITLGGFIPLHGTPSAGASTGVSGGAETFHLSDVALAPDGTVYYADQNYIETTPHDPTTETLVVEVVGAIIASSNRELLTGEINLDPGTTVSGMAVQSDGKLVVAEQSAGVSQLVRYVFPGAVAFQQGGTVAVDSTFNGATFTGQTSTDTFGQLAVRPDDAIMAIGSQGGVPTLLRFNSDGSADNTFRPAVNLASLLGTAPSPTGDDPGLTLQPDGSIVIAGATPGGDFLVMRLSSQGTLDPSFGQGGMVVTDVGGIDAADSVSVDPDTSDLLVTGDSHSAGLDHTVIVAYQPNGTLDPGLGTGGILDLGPHSSSDGSDTPSFGFGLPGQSFILESNDSILPLNSLSNAIVQFGDVNGKNLGLKFDDGSTIRLRNGTGTIFLGSSINMTLTGGNMLLACHLVGNPIFNYDFGAVTVNGNLSSLSAPGWTLDGNFLVNGSIGTAVLGHLAGTAALRVTGNIASIRIGTVSEAVGADGNFSQALLAAAGTLGIVSIFGQDQYAPVLIAAGTQITKLVDNQFIGAILAGVNLTGSEANPNGLLPASDFGGGIINSIQISANLLGTESPFIGAGISLLQPGTTSVAYNDLLSTATLLQDLQPTAFDTSTISLLIDRTDLTTKAARTFKRVSAHGRLINPAHDLQFNLLG